MYVAGADRVHFDVGALSWQKGLVQVNPVSSDRVLIGVEIRRLVFHLPVQLLRASTDTSRVIDPDVVSVPILWLLHKGLVYLLASVLDEIIILDQIFDLGQIQVVDYDVVWTGHVRLLHGPVHCDSAAQDVLGLDVIYAPRVPQLAIFNALLQGEALRGERDQAFHYWPLLGWLIQNIPFLEDGDAEIAAGLQSSYYGLHRLRRSLRGHAADAQGQHPALLEGLQPFPRLPLLTGRGARASLAACLRHRPPLHAALAPPVPPPSSTSALCALACERHRLSQQGAQRKQKRGC
mmetsp:Transcript_73739/g.240157  ORF Transcript_73739/g.240157 Transcript_73739/m.240157 type:complete len:292 (-) Transcript_73739:81-956(-)